MEVKLNIPTFVKVDKIEPAKHCFNIYAKIVEAKHSEKETFKGPIKITEGVLADESGSVKFKFVGDNFEWIQVGKIVAVRNGLSSIIDEHIVIEADRFGRVSEESNVVIESANLENNISKPAYVKKVSKKPN